MGEIITLQRLGGFLAPVEVLKGRVSFGFAIYRNIKPPSTTILVPVTKSDAGLLRKMATPRRSVGMPHLPAGVLLVMYSSNSGLSRMPAAAKGVLKYPGAMQLTYNLSGTS